MSTVKKDIKNAMRIIDDKDNHIDRFERLYPFATENVYGCFDNYDFKDKDCLSVLGSSSQMLYMYLNGAKNVTTFDINNLTVYYFYFLKAFLLSNLDKEDYVNLFSKKNFEDKDKIFSEISNYLKGDAYTFWKKLYSRYGVNLFKDERLFYYVDTPTIYHTCGLLDIENLNKARSIINYIEPNFIHTDIRDLPNHLTKNYDLIYLSNIIEYADNIYMNENDPNYKVNALIKYKELLMKIANYLKDDGLLYAGYIYEPYKYYKNEPLYNEERKEIFNNDEFYYHTFEGYNDIEWEVKMREPRYEKDACLIYKKR